MAKTVSLLQSILSGITEIEFRCLEILVSIIHPRSRHVCFAFNPSPLLVDLEKSLWNKRFFFKPSPVEIPVFSTRPWSTSALPWIIKRAYLSLHTRDFFTSCSTHRRLAHKDFFSDWKKKPNRTFLRDHDVGLHDILPSHCYLLFPAVCSGFF